MDEIAYKHAGAKDISEVIMEQLGDQIREIMEEEFIQILKLKTNGFTVQQIADKLEISVEKVQRLVNKLDD